MLTPEEKRDIVNYITDWSAKPLYEGGVIERIDGDNEQERDVEDFLEQCAEQLSRWVEAFHS